MQYIVHGERVSRDIYYFCKELKKNNKTFILFNSTDFSKITMIVRNKPEYDYYINSAWNNFTIKTDIKTKEWYEKNSCTKTVLEDLQKRYQRSRFKDVLTFEQWYTKNGWELKFDTIYELETNSIPNYDKEEFVAVEGKLFSNIVPNSETLFELNKLQDTEIKYVLRGNQNTEIIFFDEYLEIKEDDD